MKRFFDLILTVPGFILISPLLVFLAFFVRLFNGSPVFFSQLRPGKNGKPFQLFKFRTMTESKDADGNLLPDNKRLTSFGRFLRSTSLDEFPELINVLKGDMSLVGPRPLLMEYLPLYSPEQNRRHEIKPGITGWAQVNGRNAINWDEKFKLDVWYVDHQSIWLDVRILTITMVHIFMRKGINHSVTEPMPFFKGSRLDEAAS